MSVHFKLKSEIDYDTYSFEGNSISVGELKKYIQKKRLGKSTDFDLLLTNSQTNEEYKDETLTIPKNTSIIVSRIPVTNSRFQHSTPISTPASNVPAPLIIANGEGTEGVDQEDLKINALLQTSVISNTGGYNKHHHGHHSHHSHHYSNRTEGSGSSSGMGSGSGNSSSNSSSGGGNNISSGPNGKSQPERAPHPNYICHRCNQTGHFINQCPTNGDPKFDKQKMKKPSGIPVTFLKPLQPSTTQTPMGPSTVLMPGGGVAVVLTNESQFNKMAKTIISTEEAKKQKQLQQHQYNQPLSPTSSTNTSSKVDEYESYNIEECKKCNKSSVKGIKANCCSNEICFDCIEINIINMNKKTCPLCFCPFDISESGEEGDYIKNGIPQFYKNKKRDLESNNNNNNNNNNHEDSSANKKRFKASHNNEYNNESSTYQKPKYNNSGAYHHQEKYYRGDQRYGVDPNIDYRYPNGQYPYPPYPYNYYDQQLQAPPYYNSRNGHYRDENETGDYRDGRDRRDKDSYKNEGSRRDDRDRDRDRDYKSSSGSSSRRDDRDRDRDYKSSADREDRSGRDKDYRSSSTSSGRDRDGRDYKSSTDRDRDRDRDSRDYKSSADREDRSGRDKDYRSSSNSSSGSKRY